MVVAPEIYVGGAVWEVQVGEGGYDWPNLVVQVVIAIATIGTLAWAVRTGRDEAKRASAERQERLEFEERAQATRVSAWEHQRVEQPDGTPVEANLDYDYGTAEEKRRIYVHNGSDAPVYDVVVRYDDLLSENSSSTWMHAILLPGSESRSRQVTLVPNCGAPSEDVVLEIEFRDAAGRYWSRDADGILRRKPDLEALTPRQRLVRRMETT